MDEAAAAMGGSMISGNPAAVFDGIVLDSRRVQGGELFFALPGEQSDGHRYVDRALAAGAAGAVVERAVDVQEAGAAIRVDDSYAALHQLTRAARQRTSARLVGLTGSAGKTTTKELLAAMLGRRFRTARSPGNFNNLYGFPVAMLGIPDDTEWLVAEMGMSTPDELAQISRLARPDAAMILNVRAVHLENFGTLRAIAEAKSEILAGLPEDGLMVANADDPEVARIARRRGGRQVLFSAASEIPESQGATPRVVASEIETLAEAGSRFRLSAWRGGERVDSAEVHLPLLGRHNVENCLAAAACAWALGVPLAEAARAAAASRPAAGRGEVHRLDGGITLIDDSYNSNPDAVERAVEAAAALPAKRRWAVLGAMLELGPDAPRFHREAARAAAEAGFAPLIAVGAEAEPMAAEVAGAEWLESADEAADRAAAELRSGDLVLIKGSRGIGLEAVVSRLLDAAGKEGC